MEQTKELQDLTNVLWAVREIRFMLLEWYPEKVSKALESICKDIEELIANKEKA